MFELKRGRLSRDAIAQIIDYASDLDAMELDILADQIAEGSGAYGIAEIKDFQDWYGQQFGELESLKPLRLFLVGLGADDRTERMVRFLAASSSMDISLLTFHGFDQDGKTFLAKQVEVKAADDLPSARRRGRRSRAEMREVLNEKLERSNVAGLYDDVKAMFEANWPASTTRPTTLGLSLSLRRPTGSRGYRACARIDPGRDRVLIIFYSHVIQLCKEEFGACVDDIPHKTWPPGLEPLPLEDKQPEIQFKVTPEIWVAQEASLSTLVRSIYEAWHSAEKDGR